MQKKAWEEEYKKLHNLPSTRHMKPSRALTAFLKEFNLNRKKSLDIGSGKGRNSIFLAQKGFNVVGIEMVQEAIDFAQKKVEKLNLSRKVKFINQNIGLKLPFKNNSFDLIIDMITMHLLNKKEREIYFKEIVRLLNHGGFFVFYTISSNSPDAKNLFRKYPGPEENSYIIPQTGMIEKAFSKNELVKLLSPLKLVKLEKKEESTLAFNGVYKRVYYYGVFRKI